MKRCTTLCCNLLLGLLLLACTPPWSGPPFVQPTVGVTNNPAQYVNPFVGTARGGPDYDIGNAYGNTFPGADTPFGMIQWSPDTDSPINGGYNYNSDTITGFSLTHLSG